MPGILNECVDLSRASIGVLCCFQIRHLAENDINMVRPGKPATSEANRLPSNTFVLDNGGYGIKAGFASQDKIDDATLIAQSHVIPNALARTHDRRTYVGAQLDTTINRWNDVAFRRPVEKGQLVNWEAQKEIWEHSFFDPQTARRDLLIPDPEDTTLILTEGPNTMSSLQKNADEIIVEEWGFGGYARVLGVWRIVLVRHITRS